ncbi:Sterol 3-beta-glucosyltransferase [Pseudogymnoascus australis]
MVKKESEDSTATAAKMEPKDSKMSAFERKRLENIAANQAIMKDLSTTAKKIIPKTAAPKPPRSKTPRKREPPVKREATRPTRTSSRIAGLEADGEGAKRKFEEEFQFAQDEAKAKKMRVAGDLNLSDIAVEGKKWTNDNNFLSSIMRGAQPYERTFDDSDIKTTTNEELKSLREKMSGLELYKTWEPNDIKITPERIYSMGFHPTHDKPLIFAGDKIGNLGLFDASQKGEVDDDGDQTEAPVITAFKLHSRTITSLLFPANHTELYSGSYDSSIRKLDLQKQVAVEVYAPPSMDDDEAISAIDMNSNDPNLIYFSRLDGAFGRHDMRTKKDTEIWYVSEKKVGGFSLHPLHPHLVATASLDRTLKIWDLRKSTGKGEDRQPGLLGEHTSRLSVSHAAWSSSGHVATSSYDDTIKIHSFTKAKTWGVGHTISEEDMEPTAVIRHNNQTGRWVTILKAQWQQRPDDGIAKFVIGNMNRFVDIYTSEGEQLAQLGGDGISAVPAAAEFHPTRNWVAGGTASGAYRNRYQSRQSPSPTQIFTTYPRGAVATEQTPRHICLGIPDKRARIMIRSHEDIKKRVGRKLTKKRREDRRVTMEIPPRFEDGDDADEDCTAPKGQNGLINQSVFGMIAAAGSQADFHARFDGQDSDDDEDETTEPHDASRLSEASSDPITSKDSTDERRSRHMFHRRNLSDNKLLRSLSQLGSRNRSKQAQLSTASSDPVTPEKDKDIERDHMTRSPFKGPPIMSQMLEAKAAAVQRASFDSRRSDFISGQSDGADGGEGSPSDLAIRLMEIFEFESPELVIDGDYDNEIVKSGYLSKRGLKNPKYNRYWFSLQGDVLSYYTDPSDKYFPSGNIDLRYGISASVVDKDKTMFEVITNYRRYQFHADSIPSAKEWVKALQKIIFRSHNDGDSVKISLPIENVIDVEDSPVIEFAETCKIRVIDNDETYAIDEYFFSFFSFGKQALTVLRTLVSDSAAKQIPEDLLVQPQGNSGGNSPKVSSCRPSLTISTRESKPYPNPAKATTSGLEESVKATLSPMMSSPLHVHSPRASGEFSRTSFDINQRSSSQTRASRRSMDVSRLNLDGTGRNGSPSNDRRSFSRNRAPEKRNSEKQDSSDSYVHSMEESSAAAQSASEDATGSASQILRGSEGFFQPTIHRSASASRRRDDYQLPGGPLLPPTVPHHAATMDVFERPKLIQGDNASTPSLQTLAKAGAYPLQRAAGFANYLNRHSKRMSNLLATESMGYVEKVSGMWKGGKKHYDEPLSQGLEDDTDDEGGQSDGAENRFQSHFALPAGEKLQAAYFGYFHRVLPLYGKIYISNRSFCFRSLLPGSRTKLILPLKDIENVDKEKGFRFGYSGLVVVVKGHEELFFEFGQPDTRDDCCVTLLQNLETIRYLKESGLLTQEEEESAAWAVAEHKALQEARQESRQHGHDLELPTTAEGASTDMAPIMFDDPRASILNFKPTESLRITCLTIGSRGDVQPYIALCKGFIAEGHRPKIATHVEFKDWIEGHGIEFAPVGGDPAELMRICVENGMFTYSFLKEASTNFRGWIDDLLSSSWLACQNSDVLIESPSAMAGIHIAEALGIPYFRAFTMPWTRTRAYPHAFAVPEHKMGGAYNYITYVMFENVFWKAIAGQINRWRKKELSLPRTSLEKMQPNKVPFLYNFSPSVVVPPLDYSDWIRVTGYWFLDEGTDYTPPKEISDFIAKARADGKKLVYIGFGSIVVSDSAALTKTVVNSVLKADVRCILSKGWSDRLDKVGATEPEVPLPEDILQIKSAPHDWLFTQVDAVTHHGGSGTTGASLRAGKPTIIKPFFGDQFFYGSRVEDLGVGIYLRKLNVSVFARALWEATHSQRIIAKAKLLGEQIRSENGVDTAIQCIYRDMEYANSLIKRKSGSHEGLAEDIEESWTFIGDDNDPELMSRIHAWDPRVVLAHSRDMTEPHLKDVAESPVPTPRSETPLPSDKEGGSK